MTLDQVRRKRLKNERQEGETRNKGGERRMEVERNGGKPDERGERTEKRKEERRMKEGGK